MINKIFEFLSNLFSKKGKDLEINIEDNSEAKAKLEALKKNFKTFLIYLSVITNLVIIPRLVISQPPKDMIDYKSLYEDSQKENEKLRGFIDECVKQYGNYINAKPKLLNFKNGKILFTIADITYSIQLESPSELSWKNLNVSLGYTTPNFANINNLNFDNSRIHIDLSYSLFGLRTFARYDFVSEMLFGVEINLVYFADRIFQ